MPRLIKDGAIIDNLWQKVPLDGPLPEGDKLLVPLTRWQAERDTLLARGGELGIILEPGQEPQEIAADLPSLQVVAVNFPVFRDGRGYSYARELRTRLGFACELRAIGDVLQDQLFYLWRCGFNAFEIREDRDIEEALTGLKTFTLAYQGDVHDPRPIWKRA